MRLKEPATLLRLNRKEVLTVSRADKVLGEGARYLGYGVKEAFLSQSKGTKAGELTRRCLSSPVASHRADGSAGRVEG